MIADTDVHLDQAEHFIYKVLWDQVLDGCLPFGVTPAAHALFISAILVRDLQNTLTKNFFWNHKQEIVAEKSTAGVVCLTASLWISKLILFDYAIVGWTW